jgi:hypothetical protein
VSGGKGGSQDGGEGSADGKRGMGVARAREDDGGGGFPPRRRRRKSRAAAEAYLQASFGGRQRGNIERGRATRLLGTENTSRCQALGMDIQEWVA